MKKFYFLASALISTTLSFAQTQDTISFETVSLATDSYDNGSDGSGDFTIDHSTFENVYDTGWDYMVSGFAVSNLTDNITAGFMNQYSSFTGSGFNSENYAVCSPSGTVTFETYRELYSIRITNSTYAALSMRDGDQFGKQFGSNLNAAGEDDGTNGEDYFIVHIIPLDANGDVVNDTIDFYLADYRFADNNQDYIIDSWVEVDLGNVHAKSVRFEFSSSDEGDWGINTPTYVVIDDLVTAPSSVSINENELNVSIYPNPCTTELKVQTEGATQLEILNTQGSSVMNQEFNSFTNLDLTSLPAGVYFAQITVNGQSTVQKFIKQ